jgi:transcriptional regulator
MYRPGPYVEDGAPLLHDIIRTRPFALIAAGVGGDIAFAYAPVVVDADGERGGVRFHLARANPLAAMEGVKVRLSFLGPDTYISPDWYVSEGLVPTWNYIAIEAAGVARQLDRPALHQLLVDLSAQEEARLSPKTPWTLDKVPVAKREALLNAIVGFSVPFDTLEGKFKLSQDKKSEDFEGAVSALEERDDAHAQEVATAMRLFGWKRKP